MDGMMTDFYNNELSNGGGAAKFKLKLISPQLFQSLEMYLDRAKFVECVDCGHATLM